MATDRRPPPTRQEREAEAKAWLRRQLVQLVGRAITGVDVTAEGFPVLILDNRVQVLVSRDEEGNGPGALLGL